MRRYSKEEWREIPGFPGNEASNLGGLRTYWYKVRNARGYGTHRELRDIPRPIPMSLDDNGYLHVNIYCDIDVKRYTRKTHTLVACTFLPYPDDFDDVDYTVDHIRSGPEGKLDNSVDNLQWLSRSDNIRKAYRDGMCDARIRSAMVSIVAYDNWLGKSKYFRSINDAAYELGIPSNTIAHAARKYGTLVRKRYYFEYANEEDDMLYGWDDQCVSWV